MASPVRRRAGREHTRAFERKVDAQRWIEKQISALLRGDHVAPRDAKLTVGEWCDKWLAGYGTRRKSTVRQAEVHLKIIKAHFGSVPLSAVKPSDVRTWTATLKAEGRADSYIYALHSRLSQLFTDAVHDVLVVPNPCSRRTSPGMGRQRPYVATTNRFGRSTTRCRPAYVPRSCSAPTPGCASPRRPDCGSRTSTSRLA
jgi:hypothetical protein